MESYFFVPIGRVHSRLKDLSDCPLQEHEGAPEATLSIDDSFVSASENIEVGDRLILLTWLHLASRKVLKCYPRNEKEGPVAGVFSTRSPDRPNPIGLHTVRVLEKVSSKQIRVRPLEVLDGTPLLDIKPVINEP